MPLNPRLTFLLRDVLPADQRHAATARFLVVARQTWVVFDSLMKATHSEPPGSEEARFILFGYYVAAIKELADAFRDLDANGYLEWLLDPEANLPDLASEILQARAAVDKSDPSSLYCRLLKRVRDNAGFHIQRGEVLEALGALALERFRGADVKGPEQSIVAVPVVATILAYLIHGPDRADLSNLVSQARELHSALQNVAHDLYMIRVRFATELGPEAV